jgi:uncharacterized protein YbjT (DUF2867 family)
VAEAEGLERLVLLSGRGEVEAQRCERIALESAVPTTVVRCGWFNQNFSESFFRDLLLSGSLRVPNADVGEAFVDADDIADVATAALTEPRHAGQVYELTGPELLSLREVGRLFSDVTGRQVAVSSVPREEFVADLRAAGLTPDFVQLVDYLFSEVLDGRNASLGDGVQRALGRPPRDFRSYLERAHLAGAWSEIASA